MDVTAIGVSHDVEDDVEEGEILDEEGLDNVKTADSISDRFQGNDLVCSNRSSYVFFAHKISSLFGLNSVWMLG